MSPVYLNPPPTSPISFIDFKGDFSANNFSYTTLDHHDGLAIEYSWNHQDKVDKVLTYDHKSNDVGQASQSSPWPQNYMMDGTHGYSSSHGKIKIVTNNEQKNSKKWKPSKVRIMQKMMASSKKFGDDKVRHDLERRSNLYKNNNNNNGVRVCVDCHTTTTPLWRSGPQGPKTLCNACGIRQRKARRAAMLAAAVAKEGIASSPIEAPKQRPKVDDEPVIREKHHTLPLKKRGKIAFEDANWNNNNSYITSSNKPQRAFPRDEEEGAILLMALSCGLACSS